ncbi:hypothetical protein LEMLEM_LOCUS995, partial [Lemmus lemmus]
MDLTHHSLLKTSGLRRNHGITNNLARLKATTF